MRFGLLVSLLLIAGCSTPLSNSYDSPEGLARAVLDAIEKRDDDALRMLALDKDEFAEHVWPELPAARPERNLSVNFVWGDLNQKSNLMLRKTLAAHGGIRYVLTGIRFLGETTEYASFRVQRESELSVKGDSGEDNRYSFRVASSRKLGNIRSSDVTEIRVVRPTGFR